MICPKCKKKMRYDINCFNGTCDYKLSMIQWMFLTGNGRLSVLITTLITTLFSTLFSTLITTLIII